MKWAYYRREAHNEIMANNYYAKNIGFPHVQNYKRQYFLCGKIDFSLALIKNKIPKKQETTNQCFQSKCKQKHTQLYLVKRTCWYQTSGLCSSLYLLENGTGPILQKLAFHPICLSWKAKRTGLTGSLLQPASPPPPPANFWALFECNTVQTPCSPLLDEVFWNLDLLAQFI